MSNPFRIETPAQRTRNSAQVGAQPTFLGNHKDDKRGGAFQVNRTSQDRVEYDMGSGGFNMDDLK